MTIRISELTPKEIATSQIFMNLVQDMWRLPERSRQAIYKRWQMLYLMSEKDCQQFEQNLKRIHDDSGRDRRHG